MFVFQSYEKCFSLCQYTISLILRELNKPFVIVDQAPPKIPFRPKTFQEFELTTTLLEPIPPPLHPNVLPPLAQLSPPQPPPPDLEDKVNFPTKVREVEENNVALIVNTLLATAPHTPNGHFEITLEFLKIDFPWKTDYVEVQDVLNFPPGQKQQSPEISI